MSALNLHWRRLLRTAGEILCRLHCGFRLRGILAADPTAQILHNLLIALVIWLLTAIAVDLRFSNLTVLLGGLMAFMLLILAVSLTLLDAGRLRPASLVYLWGSGLIFTVIVCLNGGINSAGLVFYAAIPVSAAWLLGARAAITAAALCVAGSGIVVTLEWNGVPLPRYLPGTPVSAWLSLIGALVIVAVPVSRMLQVLKESLARSQEAESMLREHRQRLETLVRERTAELEAARDRAEAETDRANAAHHARNVVLASMNHELRTPLNSILGLAALVRADNGLSDRHWRDLDKIRASGEHLLHLVDDVLETAKLDSAPVAVESAPFDLYTLAEEGIGMMQERAAARNVLLRMEIARGCPRFVRCDSGKIRQILINLAGNAIKYTDEGTVVVRLDARPQPGIPAKTVLILDVEDTGIGIAPEDQDRIFEPWVQAGGDKARKGSGLGLDITRRLTVALGGTLTVQSTLGQGARFRVEIPAEPLTMSGVPDVPPNFSHVVGLEPGQPDYRILIVGDPDENSNLLQRLLHTVGFQARSVDNGNQAVRMFGTWRPHFIWIDLQLPGSSGLDATRRIRLSDGGTAATIVALTSSDCTVDREQVLAAGLDGLLRKPFRVNEIYEYMARHLGCRYVFRSCPSPPPEECSGVLHPEEMVTLSQDLRRELMGALTALDAHRIEALIGDASRQNPALGNALSRLACRYAYTPIFVALKKAARYHPSDRPLPSSLALGDEGASGTGHPNTAPPLHTAARSRNSQVP